METDSLSPNNSVTLNADENICQICSKAYELGRIPYLCCESCRSIYRNNIKKFNQNQLTCTASQDCVLQHGKSVNSCLKCRMIKTMSVLKSKKTISKT